MEKKEKVIGILNDLIRINHDRIVGYEKGIDELKDEDADLLTLFQRYTHESRQFVNELTHEVTRLGGDPADGTTNSGKIYRVWMDLKAVVTGHGGTDRHSSRGQIQGSVGTALSSRYGFRPSSLLRYRHRMDDEITTGARQLPTSPIAAARLVLSLPSKSGSLAMFAAILRASSSVSTFAH